MSKTITMIQARMSSSRFPGKVLETIAGTPMIVMQAERARRARLVDEVIVVTSLEPDDDPLVDALESRGVPVFRGPLDDVLARYARAADHFEPSYVVRLTGDCPLIDPSVIDQVIEELLASTADYASNIDPPTYPDGLDVEVFTRAALNLADASAVAGPDREHVTLWMRSPEAGLQRVCSRFLVDASALRLTVDYPDDLEVVRDIVEGFEEPDFDLFDILRELDRRPELLLQNQHRRNEGLAHSLAAAIGEPL